MPAADAAIWREIGLAVSRRRIERGYPTQQDLADAAGVHLNTISRLERGAASKRRNPTWGQIERALDWPQGTIGDMVQRATRKAAADRAAATVRQTVLDAIHEVGPHLTIGQARQIATITVERLRREKILPADPDA